MKTLKNIYANDQTIHIEKLVEQYRSITNFVIDQGDYFHLKKKKRKQLSINTDIEKNNKKTKLLQSFRH